MSPFLYRSTPPDLLYQVRIFKQIPYLSVTKKAEMNENRFIDCVL